MSGGKLGELETVLVTVKPPMPPVEITGYLIGHINTRNGAPGQVLEDGPRPKWSNSRVWKTKSGLYVIARESLSLIYHRLDTSCMTINQMPRGEVMEVSRMMDMINKLGFSPADAHSCGRCRPGWPRSLKPDQLVRYETPRITLERCPDGPAQVIQQLIQRRTHRGVTTTDLPGPAEAIIEQCEVHDPDWLMAAAPEPERIG